jgi:hypothetical protein
MADDDPTGDRVAKEWPLEGHVVVPGSGLYVTADCLGQTFTSRFTSRAVSYDASTTSSYDARVFSRTASYDLTIGLPQLDPGSTPPGPLIPPEWAIGPSDETERAKEREAIYWGYTRWDDASDAYVFRCRYYTTLTASDHEEFDDHDEYNIAVDDFGLEFEAWWKHFTSWVDILASQDLAGPPRWKRREMTGPDNVSWTSDAHGQRADIISISPTGVVSNTFRILELHDLEACAIAAGNGPPPAEWLLIRDARSQVNAGFDEVGAGENLRRAVIDAGAAAELAMTALIDKYLDDANALDPVRKALARSSTNLGGKHQLLRLLRPGLLSDRVQTDLIDKRNGASHRGEQYTWEEAQAALDTATAIVESANPLASLLPNLGGSPAPHSA